MARTKVIFTCKGNAMDPLKLLFRELFGIGKTHVGSREFNYTRDHSHKTNTWGYRNCFGTDVRTVSGTCNLCHGGGSNSYSCRGCQGSGQFTGHCRNCQGTGLYYFKNGRTASCRRCEGSGKFSASCRRCSGTGQIQSSCKKCDGAGTYSRKYYSR